MQRLYHRYESTFNIMTDSDYPEAAKTHNPRSLNTLIRAITLSSGRQFSLIFVRCNYTELQEQICQDLHEQCGVEILELVLSPSTDTLYSAIKTEVSDKPLSALMILGLETVTDLDNLLLATNHARDEFRKDFKFPIVILVTDEVLKKLVRLAPDLYNWGAPPISFFLTPEALIEVLNRGVAAVFAEEKVAIPELELALKDLQERGEEVAADLAAGLEFVFGKEDYIQDNLDDVIVHYQQCLSLWESPPNHHPERKGIVLIHLGFCHWRQAELNRAEKRRYWQEARDYFQQGLGVFEAAQRLDLVAQFIGELGEVLRQLEDWDELQELVKKGLRLHQNYGSERQQARDYGFLAEVALARGNWHEAKRLANQALDCRDAPWRVLYLFLLAKAQQGLNQIPSAIETLERVRIETHPQANPQVYSDCLKELQRLYFNQKDYLKAFAIKQEQGLVESQLGLRAFIGASRLQPLPGEFQEKVALEITASGRGRDVERLMSRIARDDCKLTVIHGQSGVGKSSIVNGGLVPALRQKMVKALDVLPIPLRVYTHWVEELGRLLVEGEKATGNRQQATGGETSPPAPLLPGEGRREEDRNEQERVGWVEERNPTPSLVREQGLGGLGSAAILAELRQNEQRHRLVVLIFDQFEEFFFVCQDTAARKPFFEFLSDCLNLPDVKVILSLREDYLHYLLECERLARIDVINNDILNKSNRYELGDFAPEDAQAIIEQLTARSQFHLEADLIEQLVQDLAGDVGKVRPIELQIVGAQLQAEEITTLAEYRQRGTKDELVKRYVEAVIKDCGRENQRVGELVLYLLTDEKNTRPLKTRRDLVSELTALPLDGVMDVQQLELVLKIFVDSGLVVEVPEKPEDRYQLVHDYLVGFIRQQEGFGIVAELKAERERRRRSEAQLKVVEQKTKQRIRIGLIVLAGISLLTIGVGFLGFKEARKLEEVQKITDLELAGVRAIKKFKYQSIEALLVAMEAGQDLKKLVKDDRPLEEYPTTTPLLALQTILDNIWERNQLQYQNRIISLAFSADGKHILTGSDDNTVRLWDNQGNLIQKFTGHQNDVNAVAFSPDGKHILTGSLDKTACLWDIQGNLIQELTGHQNDVNAVAFSPDGKHILTGADDKTARLWDIQGNLIKELTRHQNDVNAVAFSPDGKHILTGADDKTARLWDIQGNLIKELTGHQSGIYAVAFSADGKQILTGSLDNITRLWDDQGNLIKELTGHQSGIYAVAFSADGKQILSGSYDNTTRLWDIQGNVIQELTGHQSGIYALAFSPDGKQILTGLLDKTACLWDIQGNLIQKFTGHQSWVIAVAFSPNGKQILTGSLDKTARLWDIEGNLIQKFTGHQGGVLAVAFSPNGKQILTGSDDQTARLWDIQGNLIQKFTGHQDGVYAVAFSPDGKQILTGSLDNTPRLWDIQGKLIQELTEHQGRVIAVAFSPDGKQILTGSWNKTTWIWDLQGRQIAEFAGRGTISPDWRTIALIQGDKVVLKPVYRHLDELLTQGCDWLKDYLASHPQARERLPVCGE